MHQGFLEGAIRIKNKSKDEKPTFEPPLPKGRRFLTKNS